LLGSVASHATDDEINKVIEAVRGKTVHQLIADGQKRLGSTASVPAASTAKPAKEAPKK
jgi:ribosomal protein L12E/L44/L45/RPP1/RPP2